MNAPWFRSSLILWLPVLLSAQGPDHAAWTHRAPITVPGIGLAQLELPLEVLHSSASAAAPLADLRLVNPSGVETSWDILWPRAPQVSLTPALAFKANLVGETTVLEIECPAGNGLDEVVLQTQAQNFIKAATLEGTHDGGQWQSIASGEVLCRQQGTVKLSISFPPASWKRLRVTVDDRRGAPIAFTGASVRLQQEATRTVAHAVSLRERREEKGETRLLLDLGGPNVFVGALRFRTPEAVFQREVSVHEVSSANSGATLASGSLFRVTLDDRSAAELEIPLHRRLSSREIEVRIRNGDSPPLKIDAMEVTRHLVPLVFHANVAGAWQLYTGNSQASAPRYDIAAFTEQIRRASPMLVTVGPLEPNSAFRRDAAMPEAGEAGAALDIAAWSWRKPVTFTQAGVLQVELDAEVLARAEEDLRDLRVVQAGRQIPFLLQRTEEKKDTAVSFAEEPDAKKPHLSRWRITLPIEAFPAVDLLAQSPTPLFERVLTVSENRRDSFGQPSQRFLGSGNWRQTPGQSHQEQRLTLHSRPMGRELTLETDNGDNAPLRLASLRVTHRVVRLLCKVGDTTSPVHLCYGNKHAIAPQYDLALVQSGLNAAAKVEAQLGAEERLQGAKNADQTRLTTGVGSGWLWAALALVVLSLLWVVARLLPATNAPE